MDTEYECAHTDQITFLALLALGTEEIDNGKYTNAEDVFLELEELV